MKRLPWLYVSGALVLSGCGGSDDNGDAVENSLPVIDLQSTSSGPENTEISVSATVTDPDGSVSSLQWAVTDGDAQIVSGGESETVIVKLPAVTTTGSVSLQLTAADNHGESTSQTTTITVNQVEPVISLQEVYTGEEKSELNLMASVDLKSGDIASYKWAQISGPDSQVSGQDSDTLQVTLPDVTNDESAVFELTVTDDDGDTVAAATTVDIKRITTSLTINGLATDAPLDNANITVLLNGEEYLDGITTDTAGNYSFELVVDESAADAFVAIRAKGTGSQAAAGLISLLSNVSTLVNDSKGDGVLSVEDNPATTVSNVTTAKYALLKRAAKDKNIFSEQTVADLSEEVDPDLVLKLATAIKVAIDKATTSDTQLPEGVTDTLALIENEEQTNAYVETVSKTPQFEEAQQEIFNDPALLASDATFADAFVFYHLLASDLHTTSAIVRFFADGTGSDQSAGFTWQTDGAKLALTYDGSAVSQSFVSKQNSDGFSVQVLQENVPVSRTYQLISQTDTSQDFIMTDVYEWQYPENPEFESERNTWTQLTTVKQETLPVEITAPTRLYLTLPVLTTLRDNEEAYDATYYEQFDLKENGTATALLTNQQVQWSLDAGTLTLTGFANEMLEGETIVLRKVSERRSGDMLALEVQNSAGEPVYLHDAGVLAVATSTDEGWTADIAPGIYGYDTILGESELDKFWFELKENGIAYTVSTNDKNEDGVLQAEEVLVYSGSWEINDLGKMEITRFYNADTLGPSSTCTVQSADCLLYNLRTWERLKEKDGKLTLINIHDFKYGDIHQDYSVNQISRDIRTLERLDVVPFDISTIGFE